MNDDMRLRRLLHLAATGGATAADEVEPDRTAEAVLRRVRRRRLRRRVGLPVGSGLLAAAVATPFLLAGGGATGPRTTEPPLRPAAYAAQLETFASCPAFLSDVRRRADALVGPYGLAGQYGMAFRASSVVVPFAAQGPLAPVPVPAAAPAQRAVAGTINGTAKAVDTLGTPNSGTNIQVAGVDEPDTVKTDGKVLVTIVGSALRVVDVATERQRGSLDLPGRNAPKLLLVGDSVLVLSQNDYRHTRVDIVSIADPDHPREVRTFGFDAATSDARLVGDTARLVLSSPPPVLPYVRPGNTSPTGLQAAERANRALVDQAGASIWLPAYTTHASGNGQRTDGSLVGCTAVAHPRAGDGLGMVTVVTLDPHSTTPGGSASVLGAGGTVYATADHLYVATQRWPQGGPVPLAGGPVPLAGRPVSHGLQAGGPAVAGPPQPVPVTTQVHLFDTTNPKQPRYVASGEVPGSLLNQYAMDEAAGRLRVVTTTFPTAGSRGGPTSPSGTLTVLAPKNGQLVSVGSLGGLGQGEQVYGVRFAGDTAYVVTYRQVDPLHVIDLRDPTHPKLAGELKMPGYSAYLQPLPDHRLLGIGQSVSATNEPAGTQLALFDVSDPAAPKLLDRLVLPGVRSLVESDPHAFTYWAASHLALLPVSPEFGRADPAELTGGVAERLDVSPSGLTLLGAISHADQPGAPAADDSITRAMVVGSDVLTVSGRGVLFSTLSSGTEVRWLPW